MLTVIKAYSSCVGEGPFVAELTDTFLNTELLYKSKPHYIKLKGWNCDISHIREFDKLPIEAKKHVKFIETNLQLPITSISVGSNRNATIDL